MQEDHIKFYPINSQRKILATNTTIRNEDFY